MTMLSASTRVQVPPATSGDRLLWEQFFASLSLIWPQAIVEHIQQQKIACSGVALDKNLYLAFQKIEDTNL